MLASAVYALCDGQVCVSSVTNRSSIETAERIEMVLGWELPSAYPTLCYEEI